MSPIIRGIEAYSGFEHPMRILTPSHVQALVAQHQRLGEAACPSCGRPLVVMTTPHFLSSGRQTRSTHTVVCQSCRICGAVELKTVAPPPRQER